MQYILCDKQERSSRNFSFEEDVRLNSLRKGSGGLSRRQRLLCRLSCRLVWVYYIWWGCCCIYWPLRRELFYDGDALGECSFPRSFHTWKLYVCFTSLLFLLHMPGLQFPLDDFPFCSLRIHNARLPHA